jgi:hypothetical protein
LSAIALEHTRRQSVTNVLNSVYDGDEIDEEVKVPAAAADEDDEGKGDAGGDTPPAAVPASAASALLLLSSFLRTVARSMR